jgi:hypothetical protein
MMILFTTCCAGLAALPEHLAVQEQRYGARVPLAILFGRDDRLPA